MSAKDAFVFYSTIMIFSDGHRYFLTSTAYTPTTTAKTYVTFSFRNSFRDSKWQSSRPSRGLSSIIGPSSG